MTTRDELARLIDPSAFLDASVDAYYRHLALTVADRILRDYDLHPKGSSVVVPADAAKAMADAGIAVGWSTPRRPGASHARGTGEDGGDD